MRLSDIPLGRLRRNQQGVVAVEMALAAIILVTLVIGSFEAARFMLLAQKLDRVTTTVSDLAARSETLTATDLADIYSAAKDVVSPYDVDANGVVFLTVVTGTSSKPTITWQKKLGGTSTSKSALGSSGTATLPTGFTLDNGESVVIAEVYYTYQPIMASGMFAQTNLYQSAFNRPRLVDYPVLK